MAYRANSCDLYYFLLKTIDFYMKIIILFCVVEIK